MHYLHPTQVQVLHLPGSSLRDINNASSGLLSPELASLSPRKHTQKPSSIMNSRVFAVLVMCGLWATSQSLILEAGALAGVTALTIGGATIAAPAAAALGLGALAVLKGVLLKKHLGRRHGRDVSAMEEEENMAVEVEVAQRMDSAGCVAKLLCEIESMSAEDLSPAMSSFKTAFEANEDLKASRGVYDLAISFGSKFAKVDSSACGRLFDKCVLAREDLAAMLDTTFSC